MKSLHDIKFNRLPFRLKEFNRIMWNSNVVREVWKPRINKITHAFNDLELQTVIHGIRPAGLKFINPKELVSLNYQLSKFNLISIPVSTEGVGDDSMYRSQSLPHDINSNGSYIYRVIITSPKFYNDVMHSYSTHDEVSIGKLLGYPKCCSNFFNTCWHDLKLIDTTYFSAINGTEGDVYNNDLLRFAAVRPIFHLNCSFNCKQTTKIGKEIHELALELNYQDEEIWKHEMLSWDVEWTALHGIAEIKTPLFKISTVTDATSEKYIVRKKGTVVDKNASRGVVFPYIENQKNKITQTNSYKNSIKVFDNKCLSSKDNGFDSDELMNIFHEPIINCISGFISNGQKINSIIDFGCGNATLLKKIDELSPVSTVVGIEMKSDIAQKAQFNLSHSTIINKNIFEYDISERFNISIISPIRLIEQKDEIQRKNFIKQLYDQSDFVLFYLYGELNNIYGGVERMCNALGLYFDMIHYSKIDSSQAILVKLKQNPYNPY